MAQPTKKYKTRYQEALDILIKTKKVDGKEVVDGNTWTPHNLRRVIFGAKGVLMIYYTTNRFQSNRVEYVSFKQIKETEQLMQELQQGKRPTMNTNTMIDALYKNIVFSNVEEIGLCLGGLETEEEKMGFEKFAINTLLKKTSFKRLKNLLLINVPLIEEEFLKLNPEIEIVEQLEKAGVNHKNVKQIPELDEYKVLKSVVLDSVKYKLDAEYDPKANSKEKNGETCRLSKYFYYERERAKQRLEEVNKKAEQEKKTQIDKVAINLYLDKIMKVYRDLYESCFNLKKPVGILTPEGILVLEKGETRLIDSKQYINLYDLAVQSSKCDVQVDTANLEGVKIEDLYRVPLKGTYYPIFHLAVMSGRTPNWKFKSWNIDEKRVVNGKEKITTLEKEIQSLIRGQLIKGYEEDKDLAELADSLCTSFVVTELANSGQGSLLMFKTKFSAGNGKFDIKTFKNNFIQGGDKYFAGGADITTMGPKASGVSQVNLCLNEDLYQMMPLFAYEAVEHQKSMGKRISIKNCIIGQTVDDEILTINLTKNESKVINILAGPRAGKGVLTLNILGTILSDGCPLIYMDAKPDMATVLNEVANKNGVRVAAWDLNTPPLEYLKANPVMERLSEAKIQTLQNMGSQIPKELEESTSDSTMGLLAYLKVLQLTMVSAKLQKDRKIKTPGAGQAFFVLDELLRVYSELEVFYSILNVIEKDKKADEDLRVWCSKMTSWVRSLGQDFAGSMLAEMPNSHTSVFCLYQKASTWLTKGKLTPTQAVFTPLTTASNSTKLVGGANATAEGIESLYALQQQNRDLATKVTDYRHFGKFNGSRLSDASQCTVFKSYLVLNNAEIESQYVQDMRNNIGERAFEDLLAKGNGVVPEGVGFEGYMNTIGPEGIQSLSRGYEYLTDILNITGLSEKYGSIEEYLYDSDINSFYSKNILVEGRVNEISREVKEDKESLNDNGSWDLSEEDYVEVDGYKEEEHTEVKGQGINTNERPIGPQPSSNQNFNNQGRPTRPSKQQQGNYNNNNRLNDETYQKTLEIKDSPYVDYKDFKGPEEIANINIVKDMTNIILKDIKKIFGGLSKVKEFKVLGDGILVINKMVYKPKFDEKFINTAPEELQNKLNQGFLIDIFNIKAIYKFKNLQSLVIEDDNLAQGMLKKELGIYGKKYSVLFRKFKILDYINIGDIEYKKGNPDTTAEDDYLIPKRGFLNLSNSLHPKKQVELRDSTMERVFNSKPVRVLTNAFGWTVGTQAVFMAASMFGPVGLLFGAFAMAGAYKELKGNSSGGNSKSSKSNSKNSLWGGNKVELKKTVYFTAGKKGLVFYTDKTILQSFNVKSDIQQEVYKIAGQGGSGEIKVYSDGVQEVKQLGQAHPLPNKKGNNNNRNRDRGNTYYNGE